MGGPAAGHVVVVALAAASLCFVPMRCASAASDVPRSNVTDALVTSFETSAQQHAWKGGTFAARYASQGRTSLRVTPRATATGAVGGDWSRFRHLKVDVYNPGQVLLVSFRFTDAGGRSIWAYEYSVYSGRTTQHIRIDGLTNDFGIGEGIDVAHVAGMEIQVGARWRYDRVHDGIYIDNVRLSRRPTEPYRERADGHSATDAQGRKPPGFLLPEFPGFEAGYNTFAIDPAGYQLLARPGTGRDGRGRALEVKPLDVDSVILWDNPPRRFPEAGTYVMEVWAKGPAGSRLVERQGGKQFDLTPVWRRYAYEFDMPAGGARRFVLEAQRMRGRSVWLDDLVVYRKGGRSDLEPVSRAAGTPSTVTYADGICYLNGRPTFMLGFLRSDPEVLKGTPFNFCAPSELIEPDVSFLDACARYGLWTSVNLTATLRSAAPDNAVYFARKYRDHPALFSYYLCDEPNHSSPSAASEAPVVARATEVLRAADPRHLTQTLVIPWNSSAIYRFRDTVDILSADEYAVRGTQDNAELWRVFRACDAMRQSGTDGQVSIFTPLAARNVTREENWAQAYMCVAAGAGGIMWFPFEDAHAKWDDFLALGRELRSIEPFLVGVALERGLRFENDVLPEYRSGKDTYRDFHQIRGIGRASADRTALITVNLTPHPATRVRITAPFLAHASRATVLFEGRTVPVTDGVIVDDFAGLARHVYVVDGVPPGVRPRPVPRVGGPHVTDAGAAWRR